MKTVRGVCLAGLATLGVWSSACSSDSPSNVADGGRDESADGGAGSGGKGAGGSAGQGGTGGAPEQGGGMAGEGGSPFGAGGAEPDGGEPSVEITAPADMSTIGPGAASPDYPKVPVSFEVRHFALMPAGTPQKTCPFDACGHVHINVDGKDCNDVAKGSPYNIQGMASPMDVDLGLCKGVAGLHTVTVSLHDTQHGVVKNAAGDAIEDSITITVTSGSAEGGAPEGGAAKPDAGDGGRTE